MGILSAFCVLTVAGVANALKDVDVSKQSLAASAWNNAQTFIVIGCLCVLAAALAWCYGQTCLALANEDEYGAPLRVAR